MFPAAAAAMMDPFAMEVGGSKGGGSKRGGSKAGPSVDSSLSARVKRKFIDAVERCVFLPEYFVQTIPE